MSDSTEAAPSNLITIQCTGQYIFGDPANPVPYITINPGGVVRINVDPSCSGVNWTITLMPAVPSTESTDVAGGTIKVGS